MCSVSPQKSVIILLKYSYSFKMTNITQMLENGSVVTSVILK